MTTTQELLKYLSKNDIEFSILNHSHAKSAQDISFATHLPIRYIAQTIPMQIDGNNWMIVLPGNRKINLNAISRILHAKKINGGEYIDWIEFFPNCELNTIPPFGNLYGFRVLADTSLQEGRRIVFSACSDTQSIFMRWDDYNRLVQPIVADIAMESCICNAQKDEESVTSLQGAADQYIHSQNQQDLENFFQSRQN